LQVVNKPGGRPMGVILDEVPTIFLMGLRKIIDTGRSHLIATVLGIQSISQLIADYGKELADVIFDNCANIFSGAAKGESAKRISEIFGKIHQEKTSKNITKNDTTTNVSTQMMELLPKSKITAMSTGYFGGIVQDTFENPIKQKLCYGLLKPNMESKKVQNKYDTPVIRDFKVADHKELVETEVALIERLNFYEKLYKIDLDFIDYIEFYNDYLNEFTEQNFESKIERMQFIKVVRELKLFDHLSEVKNIIEKDSQTDGSIKKFIRKRVERMFIEKEINRVLDENFLSVLKDIDSLVNTEYYRCTGKQPEFTVFDPDKINDEIETTIENNQEIAKNFINDYNKMSTTDLLNKFDLSNQDPIFAGSMDSIPEDNILFDEDVFSSYPIEIED
jgi:hypothetical protein